jgi:hypothetical protein
MTRGRIRLGGAALLAIVAVLLGAVGTEPPAAVGQALPTVPGVPKVPRGTVSYLLHAQFTVDLQVTWDQLQGDPDEPCSSWREDSGKSEVVAGTWEETKRSLKFHWVPGSAQIYPRTQRDPKLGGGWANLTALGKATATFSRTWKQDGGSNWTSACGGSDPGLFRPSPNDCAGGRERSTTAKNASLIAVMRDGETSLLESIITSQTPGTRAAKVPAFQVDVPGAAPYRRCMTSRYGIGIPASLALLPPKKTPQAWVQALRKLKPGKWQSFKNTYTGTCDPDQEETYTCQFNLSVVVTIRRVGPGIKYP